jgi:hypothetical protein
MACITSITNKHVAPKVLEEEECMLLAAAYLQLEIMKMANKGKCQRRKICVGERLVAAQSFIRTV